MHPSPSNPGRSPRRSRPTGLQSVMRFPPVLQFLTKVEAYLEQTLWAASQQAFGNEESLEQVCNAVYHRAQAFGYEATIGVQEVYSTSMPSYPDQTVMSALLMIDLRPLSSLGPMPLGDDRPLYD